MDKQVIQEFSELSQPPSRLVVEDIIVGNANPRTEQSLAVEYFLGGVWRRRLSGERDLDNRYWSNRIKTNDPHLYAKLSKEPVRGRKVTRRWDSWGDV